MRSILGVGTFVAFGLLPVLALAQDPAVRKTITDAELQTVVQNAGYKAVIATDANGAYISSSASGQSFFVSLYGCD